MILQFVLTQLEGCKVFKWIKNGFDLTQGNSVVPYMVCLSTQWEFGKMVISRPILIRI